MKNKVGTLTIVSLLMTLSFFSVIWGESAPVPAIPNEAMIEGVVSEYAIVSSHLIGIKPEQILYRVTITIESSEGIGNTPNFLNDKIGEDIQFYTKKKLSPELFGEKIKAKVRYVGDERGGLYWIKDIKLSIKKGENP